MRAREIVAWVLATGFAVALAVVVVVGHHGSSGHGTMDEQAARYYCTMQPGIGSIYSDAFKNCVAENSR